MMATLPALGFAGIGLMGMPMCRRLLAAGYSLTVWNRNPTKCAALVEAGARQVRTLLKDLDIAVKFSREQGSATPISGLAAQLMRLHGGQGVLEKDPSTLVQLYREPDSKD